MSARGTLAEAQPLARMMHETAGPVAADAWAVALAACGRLDEARAARAGREPQYFTQAEQVAWHGNSPQWTARAVRSRAGA